MVGVKAPMTFPQANLWPSASGLFTGLPWEPPESPEILHREHSGIKSGASRRDMKKGEKSVIVQFYSNYLPSCNVKNDYQKYNGAIYADLWIIK